MLRLPSSFPWVARRPWIWGVMFGLIVGGSVLILSAAQYGFRGSNLLLALVIFLGFGLLGVIGAMVGRYTTGGPV